MQIKIVKLTDEELMRRHFAYLSKDGKIMTSNARLFATMHSPVRCVTYDIFMEQIPTFVSVHFVRHKVGVEHTVTSNREDRGGNKDAGRMTPVNHIMTVNAQSIVTIAHKRLCGKASAETRQVMLDIVDAMWDVSPDLAPLMVPLCVYRNGLCGELNPCGFNKTIKIIVP